MGNQHNLEILATAMIEGLKNLTAKGLKLNARNLAEILESNASVQTICYASSHGDGGPDAELRKSMLISALGHLARIDSRGEPSFKRLKSLLVNEADTEDIEIAFQSVKAAFNQVGKADKPSPFKAKPLECAGTDDPELDALQAVLPQVRELYLGLLKNLELDLGDDFLQRIQSMRNKITQAEDAEYMLSLKTGLEDLVRVYAEKTIADRRQMALFISDVLDHMAEIEKLLTATVGLTLSQRKANNAFNSDLEEQVDQMQESVVVSEQLDELKGMVMEKLTTMRDAIEIKRKQDENRIRESNTKLNTLRQELSQVTDKVSEVEAENKNLANKIQQDPLTGIYNRPAFWEKLASELERYQRYQRPFSLIMLDVDRFKKVNDTYGHTIGDQCLIEIVRRITPVMRKSDVLARYGGEEFSILLPETDRRLGFGVAEKLRKVIEETEFLFRGENVPVTISLGVTEVRAKDHDPIEIIDRADKAMYQAKKSGRNLVAAG